MNTTARCRPKVIVSADGKGLVSGAGGLLVAETLRVTGVSGATHLHLACHGGFDTNEPLESAQYLAGEDRLTLRDLLDGNLDLSSQRLAVLSACQTAITEFERTVLPSPQRAEAVPTDRCYPGLVGAT